MFIWDVQAIPWCLVDVFLGLDLPVQGADDGALVSSNQEEANDNVSLETSVVIALVTAGTTALLVVIGFLLIRLVCSRRKPNSAASPPPSRSFASRYFSRKAGWFDTVTSLPSRTFQTDAEVSEVVSWASSGSLDSGNTTAVPWRRETGTNIVAEKADYSKRCMLLQIYY